LPFGAASAIFRDIQQEDHMKRYHHFPGAAWIALVAAGVTILSLAGCVSKSEIPKPYLILYAFETEGRLLAKQMEIEDSVRLLGRMVYEGTLSGKDIVLAESGVGMNNAAMTTQRMIDLFYPEAVIFTGIAGAVDTSVHIGDIVVCRTWREHDYGYCGKDGFRPSPQEIFDPRVDSVTSTSAYSADSAMFAVAENLPEKQIELEKIGDREPHVMLGGVGVSGNAFIDSREKRVWLVETFDALITDMESSAVGQVCTVNGIPFIVFRSASDLAGGSGSETAEQELQQFFRVAADNSSRLVVEFLSDLK
jgi:adenosylhomocysteine nucleosidase